MKALSTLCRLALVVLLVLAMLPLTAAARVTAAPETAIAVLFIYSQDVNVTSINFLVDATFEVIPQKIGSAALAGYAATKFSIFDAIVVGSDTGSGATWNGGSSLAQAIAASGKRVLAIGNGGYALLGQLGMGIGYPHGSATGTETSVHIVNTDHPALKTPNVLPIDAGSGNLDLLNLASTPISINVSSGVPHGISVLGYRTSNNDNEAIIVSQKSEATCFTLWGMTPVAFPNLNWKQLTANLLANNDCLKRADLIYTGADLQLAFNLTSVLSSHGFEMNYITSDLIGGTNYATADVVIIADHTLNAGGTDWISPQYTAHIRAGGRPIIGIGNGGAVFFGNLGLALMRKGNTGSGTENQIIPFDPSAAYYTRPFPLTLPLPNPLTIYATSSTAIGFPRNGYSSRNVTWIGAQQSLSDNYPMLSEQNQNQCFIFWGFTYSNPSSFLTTDGANLFANLASNPPCTYYAFLPVLRKN